MEHDHMPWSLYAVWPCIIGMSCQDHTRCRFRYGVYIERKRKMAGTSRIAPDTGLQQFSHAPQDILINRGGGVFCPIITISDLLWYISCKCNSSDMVATEQHRMTWHNAQLT